MTENGNRMDDRPVLLVPYVWIGDFVRCHSVVRLIKRRTPNRPVDMLANATCAPLADYMPGVRKAVVFDIPRKRPALRENWRLSRLLKAEGYGKAIVTSRKWKAALAPALAGIPERVGFVGEGRFGLLTDVRYGEKQLPRMIDQCAVLALPRSEQRSADWPLPQLDVPQKEIIEWRARNGLGTAPRPIVALCPGAVGPSKRWSYFAELAQRLGAEGASVWILGGPGEKDSARTISGDGKFARDLTGDDLRNAILALAAANVAISNDSGLLHVAAAIGTPAIGIFGPTSPQLWAPLNPISAVIQAKSELDCRPCHKPTCRLVHHRCMRDIATTDVLQAVQRALARASAG
jgi:heptosyltransferase-2